MSVPRKIGRIYKIVCSHCNEIYVGSTTQKLCSRMTKHRFDAKTQPERLLYKHFHEQGLDRFQIILLESFPYTTLEALRAKEYQYQELLKPLFNKYKALTTPEQKLHTQKLYQIRATEEGYYRCEVCNSNFRDICGLERHYNTEKHKDNVRGVVKVEFDPDFRLVHD